MGEYFMWANPAKKEYLDDSAFEECGFMLSIAKYTGCITTRAARMLMADRWKGDPVIFLGDYFLREPDRSGKIIGLFHGCPYEEVLETYIPLQVNPCDEVEPYRYAIDHKAKEYIDFEEIDLNSNYEKLASVSEFKLDPLPILLAPNRCNPGDFQLGRWCPGAIEVTNLIPPTGYEDITDLACLDRYAQFR